MNSIEGSNPSLEELNKRLYLLREWLEDIALPLWWQAGAAKPEAGFYERLRQDGSPMHQDDRRARVQPRQVYCYAMAGIFGWAGPWRKAIDHGQSWFDKTFLLGNKFYGNLADYNGIMLDPSFDLYNQAFALFAGASVAAAMPERATREHEKANRILGWIKECYGHPLGGFEDGVPSIEPLRSNPHMHLLEAALAWEVIQGSDARWMSLSDEIAELAFSRFIDANTGALREYFDHSWLPIHGEQGQIIEPGHQFEWAWLLTRWGERRANNTAIEIAKRLFEIGETFGVCEARGVAVMGLNDSFCIIDGDARLWPQCEWLKASLRLALNSGGDESDRYLQSALRAHDALSFFLAAPTPGLWYDRWEPGKGLIDEPAPASSFYHIVSCIYESNEIIKQM
jgi:mannose/cellobiose epimerase-like protein (N-acyl-D-glucosamine 2-epimerase family)